MLDFEAPMDHLAQNMNHRYNKKGIRTGNAARTPMRNYIHLSGFNEDVQPQHETKLLIDSRVECEKHIGKLATLSLQMSVV